MKSVLEPPAGIAEIFAQREREAEQNRALQIARQMKCSHRTGPNGKPFCIYCGAPVQRRYKDEDED